MSAVTALLLLEFVTRLGRAAEPSGNIWEAMCFDLGNYVFLLKRLYARTLKTICFYL